MMVKVLGIVSFRIYPTLMGGQKGVAGFYRYLQAHVKVWLALSEDNDAAEEQPAFHLLYPNKKIYLNIFRLKRLAELVRSNQIELILAEHSYTAWIAWRMSRRTGRPFIIHSHNIESKRFRQMHKWWWKWYQAYEGWIHRKANHNFFISEEDRDHAVKTFGLQNGCCSVVTYGVERKTQVVDKTLLRQKLGLPQDRALLLFNGTLDYTPNYEAVRCIVTEIAPRLEKISSDCYILITGNRAPAELIRLMAEAKNLRYAGYVEDIDGYYQSADLFINPVANDTGVKTKLIEAIANHCPSLSTASGASGIRREVCGSMLHVIPDDSWELFTNAIVELLKEKSGATPPSFYDHYEWSNIAKKASDQIKQLTAR